jgi:hypothetical protein
VTAVDEQQHDARLHAEPAACLPRGYLIDFLDLLDEFRDLVKVITYDDLPWGDDYAYQDMYPGELSRWKQSLASGERDPRKIYVVIQHDVDAAPARTADLLREEARRKLPSNTMVFNKRLRRQSLAKSGEVVIRDYRLDVDLLKRVQSEGFVIGYHSNAYERARFDRDLAEEIFVEDVRELRESYDIRYFCPHGGVRDVAGRSNSALDVPEALRHDLRWVLNRYGVRFDGNYSDGALRSPRRDATQRDLRDFVATWKPGRRYRMLLHPQYYGDDLVPAKRLVGVDWYEELLRAYDGRRRNASWDQARRSLEQFTKPRASAAPGRLTRLKHRLRWRMSRGGSSKPAPAPTPKRPIDSTRPILIGGDGRSGTTLLSVILDSHPDLSVGPELHFNGPPNLGPYIIECLDLLDAGDPRVHGKGLNENPEFKKGVQFVRRVDRAGVSAPDLRELIVATTTQTGTDLSELPDRCRLVRAMGELTCARESTVRWGYKIMRSIKWIDRYYEVWPNAAFIHIIRDGRDVAASQLTEYGSWGYDDIQTAARGWTGVIDKTRKAKPEGARLYEVRYEDIVLSPEKTLRALLEFLEVEWNPVVLQHEGVQHAFFESSVAHPSREQTKKPINASAIGRYRRDLTPEQIEGFEDIARDRLKEFGYLEPSEETP